MQTTAKKVSVPLLNLSRQHEALHGELDAAIRACFLHQQWINGPEVAAFEEEVAAFLGAPHAVGVSSGTDALVIALRAFALLRTGSEHFTSEHEIITTAFTFTATGDAILRAGATPVFIDIDPKTYTLDPRAVAAYLTQSRGRVVGILPVHLYGHPAEMGALTSLARAHGCFLLEDAAQAFGAVWRDARIGSIGDAACLSFFPSKPLGGFGDGGMVTTRDATIAQLVRELRQHGGKNKYDVEHLGYNARLDTIQAAVLRAKLRYVNVWQEKRRMIAVMYDGALHGLRGITVPMVASGMGHAYHQYTVRVADDRRDALQSALAERGIASLVYYPKPLHTMALFRGRAIVTPLMETDRAAREVLSIPIDPFQTDVETASVIDAIRTFVGG